MDEEKIKEHIKRYQAHPYLYKDNTFHYYYCDFIGWKWIKTQGIGTQGIRK